MQFVSPMFNQQKQNKLTNNKLASLFVIPLGFEPKTKPTRYQALPQSVYYLVANMSHFSLRTSNIRLFPR